jgi:hypothetical protein
MSDNYHNQQMNIAEGISAFQTARMKAFWQEAAGVLRGQPAQLLSFDDVKIRLRLREEYYKGLQDVPLENIAGSVGRYREFTNKFLPLKNRMQERWSRVYAEATGMMGLPPIELYKVGDVYFVRDGNHRVSVARQVGAKTIQAHVTELPTHVPLKPGMSPQELDDAAAYANFLTETRLTRVRPHFQPIELSEPSRYADLLGHIYLQRDVMEQGCQCSVSMEDAVADWYDNVYRPALTLIRKYTVLDHMPGRTEGDLYLWLVDHLSEVIEHYGDAAPSRSFSHALTDFLAERRIPVPKELLTEKDRTVELSRAQVMKKVREYEEEHGRDEAQE